MAQSIVEAVAMHAKANPDKFCVADGRYELTYQMFWEHICGYAKHLQELGVEKGDCVVVRNAQNVVQLVAGLAIQLLGAIYVPVEKNVADQRILEIVDTVNAKYYIAAKVTDVPCGFERITEAVSYTHLTLPTMAVV